LKFIKDVESFLSTHFKWFDGLTLTEIER
jgi:hypothetical protein